MTSSYRRVLALIILHCFVLTASAAPRSRPRPVKRQVEKIVFTPADPILRPGKSIVLKATPMDANDNPIKSAKVEWVLPKEAEELVSLSKPINGADPNTVVLVGLTPASGPPAATSVKIQATSGSASAELVLRYASDPTEITFAHDAIDVVPGTKQTIVASVRDAAGNEIHGLNVSWKLADKKFEDLVFLGPPVNNAKTNSIDVVWLAEAGQNSVKQVPLIARVGQASGVATINYKPKEKSGSKLVFLDGNEETSEVSVTPREKKKIKAVVRSKDGTTLTDAKIECDLSEGDRTFISLNTKTKGEVTFEGLGGDLDTIKHTIVLPCRTDNADAVVVVRYEAGIVETEWAILPPKIVGDNYGRAITSNYYCIEVTINNNSGSDLALAGLRFVNPHEDVSRPVASYNTVHGTLAKRKALHPRSLTLAVVGGLGTLLTGFNPFFHDANHAKNYSQFIDILSNPLRSGLEKGWPDTYPDEVARFEQDVLRDDKIIPTDTIFKTKVFVPKRALFRNDQKEREDLDTVRTKLGILQILGYQFQKGPVRPLRTRTIQTAGQ